jgi:hypothetical protein
VVPGPIIIRVASFFPFHATYWLNGHPFMEQELNRRRIGFCKNDNAFPATDDVAALQAHRRPSQSADNPQATRLPDANPRAEVLKKERGQMNLSRFYSPSQPLPITSYACGT